MMGRKSVLLLPSCFTNSCISAMKLLQTQKAQLHFLCAFQNKAMKKAGSEVMNSPAWFSGWSLYVFLPDLKNNSSDWGRVSRPFSALRWTATPEITTTDSRSPEPHPWDSFSAPKRGPMSSFREAVSSGVASPSLTPAPPAPCWTRPLTGSSSSDRHVYSTAMF